MSRFSTYTYEFGDVEKLTTLYTHDIREGKFKPNELRFDDYCTIVFIQRTVTFWLITRNNVEEEDAVPSYRCAIS